ncbi:hypothetical protein DE146DRAFT_633512 [Phaeosphaeria sp. MPI-PUGE-AT-0046c]|nr:hypothetical protein DE146DRAFT_633512 [Phaeosphaeria sp. MPI-PUGE-AT-0046c]
MERSLISTLCVWGWPCSLAFTAAIAFEGIILRAISGGALKGYCFLDRHGTGIVEITSQGPGCWCVTEHKGLTGKHVDVETLVCGVKVNASISPQQCAHPQQHILSNQNPLCLQDDPEDGAAISNNFQHPTWSHQPFCISKKGKEYCTYTTEKFRTRHSLSIISTPIAADAIVSAFPHTQSARHVSEGYFAVQAIPGKGFGLVATQRIPKATTILLDSPRFIASAQFPSHISRAQGSSLFNHALSQLADADQQLVLSLDKSLGGSDIEDIMKTNAFSCQFHDGGEDEAYMCLFPSVARINHACRPNAHARFVPKTLLMEIKTLRDVAVGEEIGISYGRVDLKHAERQKLYKQGWNFKCTCDMCEASEYDIAGSDQRRARFAQLRKQLENLTPATYDAQQIVAWEKEVMDLSSKEGLDVLLATDYERLAYVYAGHGIVKDARMWAEKAKESLLEWKVVDGGPSNDLKRIEDLLAELAE